MSRTQICLSHAAIPRGAMADPLQCAATVCPDLPFPGGASQLSQSENSSSASGMT